MGYQAGISIGPSGEATKLQVIRFSTRTTVNHQVCVSEPSCASTSWSQKVGSQFRPNRK